jgi:hypothetical protein
MGRSGSLASYKRRRETGGWPASADAAGRLGATLHRKDNGRDATGARAPRPGCHVSVRGGSSSTATMHRS